MASKEGQKPIPIDALNPQQLVMIKKNVEEEVVLLSQSSNQFKLAINKFEESKGVLKSISEPTYKSKSTLIPITNSLYVEGVLEDNQNVLIDYGTGFFVERDIGKANAFCERKIHLLKDNLEKVSNLIKSKRKLLDQITLELQKKIQMQMQQQQPPTKQ